MSKFQQFVNGVFLVLFGVIVAVAVSEVAVRVSSRWIIWYDVEMQKYAQSLKTVSKVDEIGHEHLPNQKRELMGVMVETNSLGLRNREVTLVPAPGVFRILALGDSLTLGWGVRSENTYAFKLEERLNRFLPRGYKRVEVINAGIGNYNTTQEVTYYLSRGLVLKPNLLLLGYFINDAEPTPRKSKSLLQHSTLASLLFGRIDGMLRNFGFWGGTALFYYEKLYEPNQPGWIATQEAFRKLFEKTRETGTNLLLVLLPELHDLTPDSSLRKYYSFVAKKARSVGIEVLDIWKAFENQPEEELWVSSDDAHPNGKAHAIIAEEIATYLTKNNNAWGSLGNFRQVGQNTK